MNNWRERKEDRKAISHCQLIHKATTEAGRALKKVSCSSNFCPIPDEQTNLLPSLRPLVFYLTVELFPTVLIPFWGACVSKEFLELCHSAVFGQRVNSECSESSGQSQRKLELRKCFNYNFPHWIEPIEHNERKKRCRCGGRGRPGRGIGGFQPCPCRNRWLAAPSNENLRM